ncbi:MAG: chemotaxis protein CheB, partial [Limnobacter sp.]|nr:chemotaxis protein CheB [Limnobacter sp.]
MSESSETSVQTTDKAKRPTHIVGVGASAGGLEALEKLFRAMPGNTEMAFVVIQHLSPDFKSLMDELMMRFTSMPVQLVDSEVDVQANRIYLLAPKKEVVIEGDRLVTYDRPSGKQLSMPINVFFRSLAASWGDKAIAVVLSGTGSDGSDGVLNVRDAGGVVIVQDPSTAKFDGMPQSAIGTGCVDAVLGPEEMPSSINSIINDPLFVRNSGKDELSEDELLHLNGIDKIYGLLKSHFSIDFRLYKPSTITRRIHRRITLGGNAVSIDDYVSKLEQDQSELNALYKDLLIGVTAFFRDIDAFEALRSKAVQEIMDKLPEDQEFRVWVCGCSTGQEAYSMAMLILEEYERRGRTPLLKVFATDLHRDSVEVAADGVYSEMALESVPQLLKDKYFNSVGGGSFKVSPALRRFIIFSEHNLLKNPPFTRMNLVSCRNLLIYFRAEAQVPAVTAFNFSLVPGGVLFLGASETLGSLADDFDTVDNHWKIYKKTKESRVSLTLKSQGEMGQASMYEGSRQRNDRAQPLSRLYHHLLDKHIPSGILLSENHELLHVFGDAHRYMKIPTGRHTGDVFAMLGQSLSIALSTALRNIKDQSVSMSYRGIAIEEASSLVELTVDPLFDKASGRRFYMVLIRAQEDKVLHHLDNSVT